jgi:6-phosphogluconolactonase
MYECLSNLAARAQHNSPWENAHIFFSDERVVALDNHLSNYGLAHDRLHLPTPASQVYPIAPELSSPDAIANDYEQRLRRFFLAPDGTTPRFDLVLLGMGKDAHTASLFPHSPAIDENKRLVTSALGTPARITFTFPLINHARELAVLVSGEDKAQTLEDVFASEREPYRLPIQNILKTQGRLSFFLDSAAASRLPVSLLTYCTTARDI